MFIALFEKYKVFSKEELIARYKIWIDMYNITIGIEANTLNEMVNSCIVPAGCEYEQLLADTLLKLTQLKKEVKLSANYLLAEILKDISISMDSEPYNSLSMDHFNKASRKYREIALSQARIRRIQKVLEKQRAELDEIITEIELESPAGVQD